MIGLHNNSNAHKLVKIKVCLCIQPHRNNKSRLIHPHVGEVKVRQMIVKVRLEKSVELLPCLEILLLSIQVAAAAADVAASTAVAVGDFLGCCFQLALQVVARSA